MSLNAIYAGLRSKLVSDVTLGSLVGTRVYKLLAPGAAIKPYITYYIASGGYRNITGGDLVDVVITVEAWAESSEGAASVFDAAHNAIHRKMLTIAGYANLWCMTERVYNLPPEMHEGKLLYRMAGDVRIVADKE